MTAPNDDPDCNLANISMPQALGVIRLTVCSTAGRFVLGKKLPEAAAATSVKAVPIAPACPADFDQAEITAPTLVAANTRASKEMTTAKGGPQ